MKSMHVTSAATYQKHQMNYRNSHFLDLPSGNVVIVGDIDGEALQNFEAETDVTPLPYLMSGETMPTDVAAALTNLGVLSTDNTMQVALKIAPVHSAFHPSQI